LGQCFGKDVEYAKDSKRDATTSKLIMYWTDGGPNITQASVATPKRQPNFLLKLLLLVVQRLPTTWQS